jgi:tRNA threonylcarbamoyl adenosine modification protein YeaZ
MNVLAIDTSLPTGSVAALVQSASGTRVAERPLGEAGEHARRLMPELVTAAAALGWQIPAVDLVAVVRGPGSFTGLRVGVTTAKTLCWAVDARLVGVSGFEVVARQSAAACGQPEEVAIAFDAGRGEVFAALATPDDDAPTGWLVTGGELVEANRWLDSIPAGRWVSGPALEMLGDAAQGRGLRVAPQSAWRPSAAGAATIGILRAKASLFDDPQTLLPEYSRPSYAEEKKPGRTG